MTDTTDAVWTGSRLIAIGDRNPFDEHAASTEMAAYDPARRRWQALPAPPTGGTLMWTGHLVLLWSPAGEGYRFDPEAKRWTPMAPAPPAAKSYLHATTLWTGRQMLVVAGGVRPPDATTSLTDPARFSQDLTSPDAVAYNPVADRWHALPRVPAHPGHRIVDVTAVWTGDKLVEWWEWDHVVIDHSDGGIGFGGGAGIETVTYDARTNRWSPPREVARGSGGPLGVGEAFWSGTEVVLPSAETFFARGPIAYAGDPGPPGPGWLYDVARGSYSEMARSPVYDEAGPSLWVGAALVTIGETSSPRHDGTVLQPSAWDPATGAWTTAPPSPRSVQDIGVMVWAGDELVAFTGPSWQVVGGREIPEPMTAMALTTG